jgi:hypothetical protein
MIAVFVTFRSENLDRSILKKIAGEARGMFEHMPGLRMKAFTFAEHGGHATNVYLWDSEHAARAFFNDQLLDRVTALYGVRPVLEFADVLALVDNSQSGVHVASP